MPRKAGPGRPKGSKNVSTRERERILAQAKAQTEETKQQNLTDEDDPHEFMRIIMRNDLECGVCRCKIQIAGVYKSRYVLPVEQHRSCKCIVATGEPVPDCPACLGDGVVRFGLRTCMSCDGWGKEKCDPRLRGDMAKELAQYKAPKLKAIEVSGSLVSVQAKDAADAIKQARALRMQNGPRA